MIEFGETVRARSVLPYGTSRNPASAHYDDLTPLWLRGEYHPLILSRERLAKEDTRLLRLLPEPATQPVK